MVFAVYLGRALFKHLFSVNEVCQKVFFSSVITSFSKETKRFKTSPCCLGKEGKRMKVLLREACMNAKGKAEEVNRGEIVEAFKKGSQNVLRVSEAWEGMKRGPV